MKKVLLLGKKFCKCKKGIIFMPRFINKKKLIKFFTTFRATSSKKDKVRWNIRLVSKFMTSQPGKWTVAMYLLYNISKGKDNQTKKFGLLIEYKMCMIILEKSHRKCDGETTPRPFSKKWKLSISLDQSFKVYTVCFHWMPSWGISIDIETRLQTTGFYLI